MPNISEDKNTDENPKKETAPDQPDGTKKKSFFETFREINERERREKLEAESREAEARADKSRKLRAEYEKSLARQRVELMKLKSGEGTAETLSEPEEERVFTTKERISNFFYHYKIHLIVGTLITGLIGFFVYDIATKKEPDISVIIIAGDRSFSNLTENLENSFNKYCRDYNGDGEITTRVSYLPAAVDEDNLFLYETEATQTRLVSEFQSDRTIIVITDDKIPEKLEITDVFADLSEFFAGDPNVTALGYALSGTSFKEDLGYPDFSGDLYAAFREPRAGYIISEDTFKQNYENALDFWKNYIENNVINES